MTLEDDLQVPSEAYLPLDGHGRLVGEENGVINLTRSTCVRPDGRALVIGRQAAVADVRISHKSVGRKHALLYFVGNDVVVQDLESKYGTQVNQQRLPSGTSQALQDGDSILFGNQHTFRLDLKSSTLAENTIHGGRAQREAEIQAAMDSLEQPVGATLHSKPHKADERMHRLAKKYHIPVTELLEIEEVADRKSAARGLAIEPSGARFAVGRMDGTLDLYDFSGMDRIQQKPFRSLVPDEGHWIVDAVYSNTGDRLLVASGSAQPVLLDRDGHELLRFVRGDMYVSDQSKTTGHTAAVSSVDWHPLDRDTVLTGSADGSARLWNLTGKRHFDMLVCNKVFLAKNEKGQRTAVTCVAFHPAGREFAMGTACGSLQIFNPSRASGRPERSIFDAHGTDCPIDSIVYSMDGNKLGSRSTKAGTTKCWDPKKLSRSAQALAVCEGLPNTYERVGLTFNQDASILCAGSLELSKDAKEIGALKFFRLRKAKPGVSLKAAVEIPVPSGPLALCWHSRLNQIFVACSDGSSLIFYDPDESEKGAVRVNRKAGKSGDVLEDLLRKKASSSTGVSGEIVTPFAAVNSRKRHHEEEVNYEPERPATSKHKASTQPGGVATFQQYALDQKLQSSGQIAGADPREALLKYGNIGGEDRVLADTTAEQEAHNNVEKSDG